MEKQLLTHALNELMNRQIQLLQVFHQLLLDSQFIQGKVFALPQPEQTAETREDGPITITPTIGPGALEQAIFAWRHLYAEPHENTRLVYRLPGVIQVVTSEPEYLSNVVRFINEDRQAFKELVLASEFLKRPDDRHQFLHSHSLFPMLITLHMYRQIPMAPDNISSASFCWANKCSQQRTSRDAVLQQLLVSQGRPPKHVIDHDAWARQMEEEMVELQRLPADAQLQVRRPLPVQPQMWVNCKQDGIPSSRQMFVASTPMLIIGDRTVKIGELHDYDPQQRREPRQARLASDEPINPRLWLYLIN